MSREDALPLLALPFPAIDPVLIEVGPFALRWYALAYVAGILIGWWYMKRLLARPKLWGAAGAPFAPELIDDFVVWATIGIVAGGRIGYVLFYDLSRFLAEPLSIIAVWEGGMSFHGGFLGTILAMIFFSWRRKIPLWTLIDLAAAAVPFGLFFGRIANFINGELWGRVTELPWGIVFPTGGPEPRHPSQLYEAGLEGLGAFLLLRFLTHRKKRLQQPGFVAGAFTAWYGASRILIEFVRVPDVQIGYLAGPLTLGMALSIPMLLAGIAVMIWAARRNPVAGQAG